MDSVGNMVRKYLQEGWESQADLFEQSRSCKERCVRSDAKRQKNLALRLEFLGALRKMIVDNLFECANDQPNKTIYKAFGSTNLTSDYDLTILGPNAPSVIEKMSKAFKSQYNTSLPHAFDSNIYCTGYYSAKGSNPRIPGKVICVKGGKRVGIFSVEAASAATERIQERFALLKIHEAHPKLLKTILKHTSAASQVASEVRRLSNVLTKQLKRSKGDNKTEKKYDMLVREAKRYFPQMYSRSKYTSALEVSLFKHSCAASWASVEAYYTPASVVVVVLELQAGYKFQNSSGQPVKLRKHTYRCAALENFGDFVHHAKEMKGDLKQILLKLSKYIYRIEHCLEKLSGKTMHARAVRDGVVAHRGSGNTDKVKWTILKNQVGGKYTSLNDYIRKFTQRVASFL